MQHDIELIFDKHSHLGWSIGIFPHKYFKHPSYGLLTEYRHSIFSYCPDILEDSNWQFLGCGKW